MSVLAGLLGLVPGDPVLLLGSGDRALERVLTEEADLRVLRSEAGREAPDRAFDAVILSREAVTDRRQRRTLLRTAARTVSDRGTVVAEFANRFAALSRPLLVYEGLRDGSRGLPGGTTYRGCRKLASAAGLGRLTGFLCLPSLADPRVVLPLDSPAALSYHFQRPFFTESRRRRWLRHTLAAVAGAGLLPDASPRFALWAGREVPR